MEGVNIKLLSKNVSSPSSIFNYDKSYVSDQKNIIENDYKGMKFNDEKLDNASRNPLFEKHPLEESSSQSITNNDDTNIFNPYVNFLHKRGLDSDPQVRYNVYYHHFDSRHRKKTPILQLSYILQLEPDPLSIDGDILWIKNKGNTLLVNDIVTLSSVPYKTSEFKNVVDANGDAYPNDGEGLSYLIYFTDGDTYAKVRTKPNMSVISLGSEKDTYNTSHMFIDIYGFKGNTSEPNYIGNIPITQLNTTHRIYLKRPDSSLAANLADDGYFFIKLPRAFKGSLGTISYNIKITFKYYGGIPTNEMSAEYPIDVNHKKGFHLVLYSETNRIGVKLPRKGYFSGNFGGNNLNLGLIEKIDSGYPQPNSYKINLGRNYTNITMVKMISSEFPNTEKVFRDSPEDKRNNRIYFQNLDDADHVYSINITAGSYDPESLATEIQDKIYEVTRIYDAPSTSNFTNKNYIRVSISRNTDLVIFKSYRESLLTGPIKETTPQIDPEKPIEQQQNAAYTMKIEHQGHGISTGDVILISGSISHLGIPASIINSEHLVTQVIDDDNYIIEVSHFNLESPLVETNGGNAIKIFTPNLFRLRFDFPDTSGEQLGFRNMGSENSITPYSAIITNADPYNEEPLTDEVGNPKTIKQNSLSLSGIPYIYMTCRELPIGLSTGLIENIFAKINLTGIPGRVLYNTFVNTPQFYYDPIIDVSELTFAFYTPDGSLFDFNGLDHSFTLEITTIDNTPRETGISSKISLKR
jgi:hypothetical protein